MAVPLSPSELQRKITAIFKHESQKDKALFPGVDEREFWQRAEQRNRRTSELYDALGLAEYEAIEACARWEGRPFDQPELVEETLQIEVHAPASREAIA